MPLPVLRMEPLLLLFLTSEIHWQGEKNFIHSSLPQRKSWGYVNWYYALSPANLLENIEYSHGMLRVDFVKREKRNPGGLLSLPGIEGSHLLPALGFWLICLFWPKMKTACRALINTVSRGIKEILVVLFQREDGQKGVALGRRFGA